MIRTVLVDDSKAFRAALAALLEQAGDFQVVGSAATGLEAVQVVAAVKPDLVLMDVEMPGLDGLAATAQIMSSCPCPVVVLSALMDTEAQRLAFDALSAGAVEVLPKPRDVRSAQTRERLLKTLRAMASVKVVRRRSRTSAPGATGARLVVVGASTGGPPALREILGALPRGFPASIAIAQHLASGFTRGLSSWLREATPLKVEVVDAPRRLEPGTVYLAPDDHHLEIAQKSAQPLRSVGDSVVPSVDRLLSSAASFGPGVVGVILTGMGGDGARGMLELRRHGHHTIVQDEETSVVYGMPRVAREAGAAVEELPLHGIAARLVALAGAGQHGGGE